MGDVVALHHDLAWYNQNDTVGSDTANSNTTNNDNNWLRGGTASTPKDLAFDNQSLKQPNGQQAHALSMVANLAK